MKKDYKIAVAGTGARDIILSLPHQSSCLNLYVRY